MVENKNVGADSICARGSLPYRKRARADMESAPTFFERSASDAIHRIYYFLFILYYLSTAYSASRLMIA